jgi:hypothetical protein
MPLSYWVNWRNEMFGIELRRKGSITNLYGDITSVLAKAGVNGSIIPVEIQTASVAHSLQKMFASTYFNICVVNDCAKLVKLRIPQERLNVYQTQHCVNWSEMLPEYKQVLVAMVLDDFREVLNPVKDVVKDMQVVEK